MPTRARTGLTRLVASQRQRGLRAARSARAAPPSSELGASVHTGQAGRSQLPNSFSINLHQPSLSNTPTTTRLEPALRALARCTRPAPALRPAERELRGGSTVRRFPPAKVHLRPRPQWPPRFRNLCGEKTEIQSGTGRHAYVDFGMRMKRQDIESMCACVFKQACFRHQSLCRVS